MSIVLLKYKRRQERKFAMSITTSNNPKMNNTRTKTSEKLPVTHQPVPSTTEIKTTTAKGGAMIMKTVSILLLNSRRVSHNKQSRMIRRPNKTNRSRDSKAGTMGKGINQKMLERIKRKTNFSKNEIEALVRIYNTLITNRNDTSNALAANGSITSVIAKPHASLEGITRIIFRELMHSTFDIVINETLMERLFTGWDVATEGLPIRLEEWLNGLSVFLRGTVHEKMIFCFRIYDLNADGYLTKDEMFLLMRDCLIKQPHDEDPDEGVRDFVEIVLKKFDIDKDGKVSFNDYQQTVQAEPLLLEAFGQCLPGEGAVISFLSTLNC